MSSPSTRRSREAPRAAAGSDVTFEAEAEHLSQEEKDEIDAICHQFTYGSVTTSSAVTNGTERDMLKRCRHRLDYD